MRGLRGQVAIVTGAASGIGAATARRLCEEGAAVVLADVAVERGRAVAETIATAGGAAVFEPCDVADPEAWTRVASAARQRFGGIDAVVNNAYANVIRSTLELAPEDWRRMLDVN